MLKREVRTLVGVVGMKENLLHFLEADSAPRVCRRLLLFRSSKWNRTRYNCYTTAAQGKSPTNSARNSVFLRRARSTTRRSPCGAAIPPAATRVPEGRRRLYPNTKCSVQRPPKRLEPRSD